jgi:hypothetical protein
MKFNLPFLGDALNFQKFGAAYVTKGKQTRTRLFFMKKISR